MKIKKDHSVKCFVKIMDMIFDELIQRIVCKEFRQGNLSNLDDEIRTVQTKIHEYFMNEKGEDS